MALLQSLHCASCLEDSGGFSQYARLPACGHVFCPACAYKYSQSVFRCPIDEMNVENRHRHEGEFRTALQAWQLAKSRNEIDARISGNVVKYVNFTLFPCTQGRDHRNYWECPYDHSRPSVQETTRRSDYCLSCRAFSAHSECPRCGRPCVKRNRRLVGRSDFQPTLSSPYPQGNWEDGGTEGTILSRSSPGW